MLSIGIDTGGTYTDAVLFDPARGVLAKAKALTTKHDLALGIGEALLKVLPADPKSITLVSLSTTLATNALVEGHGNPVGLLLLGYPVAALERAGLREALRGDPVAFITGGHNGLGEEQAPLDLEAARKAILEQAPLVQSFAVAGFFAVRNPRHELRVRDLVRELTGKPVTCAHELSSNLDAPRRALTAVLNARLIPQLDLLIRAVQGLMAAHALKAPLMVVKGDGSLIADAMALTSPVETILSGPAASVVGAQHLAGNVDCFVSDIGGTTTDIAVLREGRPVLNREGATVGGFRTMVEAVAVHTFGLGGDSEVRFEGKKLLVGPRRAVPLSLLVKQFPTMLDILREQAEAELPVPRAARFALRLRRLPDDAHLKPAERAVWDALADGPQPLSKLAANYLAARALDRLMDRGLAIAATITPSDAAHLLGKQSGWVTEAAELGAKILCREVNSWTPRELAEAVYDRVVALTGEYLLESALAEENQPWERPAGLSRWLLDRGLTKPSGQGVGLAFRLDRPVVAIGAPAGTYYDEVALRLGTRAIIPADGDVCNAVGAVASGIVQRCKIIISQPVEGIYRAHMPDGIRDFHDLEPAAAAAQAEARKEAERLAILAGAGTLRLEESRQDVITQTSDGLRTFIECVIVATAAGRPRLAVR